MIRARPRFLLVGNAENRRVQLFQAALAAQGLAPARVIRWIDVASDAAAALAAVRDDASLVRIDSPGEDAAVEDAFLRLGHEPARALGVAAITARELDRLPHARGRILCPRQHHLGFLAALFALERELALRPALRVLNTPVAIAELFDKRLTSQRYAALGIPVPRALPDVRNHEELRAAMAASGLNAVYVKLTCGSSASCLALFCRGPAGDEHLMTTVEQTAHGWFNSLRVRRVAEPRRVAEVIGFLLREGSLVEESVAKARLGRRFFDCRVLAIAGEPAFTVVRSSTHPITNLHLGGSRGDLAELEARVPPGAMAAALHSCRRVAAAHHTFHVGIDLMFEPGLHAHRVLEANAFGDLLPGLRRDGLSVYEWQVRQLENDWPERHLQT